MTADPLPGTVDDTLAGQYQRHHAELVRLAVLLVHDQQTAEDVVQDAFARMHASQAAGRPGEELAYIRVSVLNACRSVLRRRLLARRVAPFHDVLSDRAASAEAEAIRAEDRGGFGAFLSSDGTGQYLIFDEDLGFVDGWSTMAAFTRRRRWASGTWMRRCGRRRPGEAEAGPVGGGDAGARAC